MGLSFAARSCLCRLLLVCGIAIIQARRSIDANQELFMADLMARAHKEDARSRVAKMVLRENSDAPAVDSTKLSKALLRGLDTVRLSIDAFLQDPPAIREGIQHLDDGLWDVVTTVVSPKRLKTDKMYEVTKKWDEIFDNAPDVTDAIHAFRTTGKTGELVQAIDSIIDTLTAALGLMQPNVAKYFIALDDLVEGIGEAWDMHQNGEAGKALEAIWDAVKVAVDAVGPNKLADAKTFKLVMGTIDDVVGKINKHVLEYKRLILESKVCYKHTIRRKRVRPNQCREGFEWDQGTLCLPSETKGADCWRPCGSEAGTCNSFCGKGKACCRRDYRRDPAICKNATDYVDFDFTEGTSKDYHQCVTPASSGSSLAEVQFDETIQRKNDALGTHRALCDMNSEYKQNVGQWCVGVCEPGYVEKNGQWCEQKCSGAFPASGWGMCGRSHEELTAALAEMFTTVATSTSEAGLLIDKIRENGVETDSMSSTINTFIHMGKPFARPACPSVSQQPDSPLGHRRRSTTSGIRRPPDDQGPIEDRSRSKPHSLTSSSRRATRRLSKRSRHSRRNRDSLSSSSSRRNSFSSFRRNSLYSSYSIRRKHRRHRPAKE